jgi:hypothetical protein
MLSEGLSKIDPSKVSRIRRTVFISYSHKNAAYLEKLKIQLEPFAKHNEIVFWDDKKIETGEKWKSEINNALEQGLKVQG